MAAIFNTNPSLTHLVMIKSTRRDATGAHVLDQRAACFKSDVLDRRRKNPLPLRSPFASRDTTDVPTFVDRRPDREMSQSAVFERKTFLQLRNARILHLDV